MNHSIKDNLTSSHVLSTSLRTRTLAVLIALITTATAWAEVGEFFIVDGVKYKITNESPYEVSLEQPAVDGLVELTIPSTVSPEDDDAVYLVTSIATNAFVKYETLTSVTIGSKVTTINAGAFQLCTALTSITIPSNVTTIGEKVFQDCTGLKKVTIGKGVTSIGADAFLGCTNVDEVFCEALSTKLTWTDNGNNDFKPDKATICYVSDPSNYSTTLSNVNVTVRQYYNLEIAGTRVTVDNKADILSDGAASYDPATNTLTLNKDITTANGTIISIFGITGLTINVPADVKLESTNPVQELINLDGSAAITGSGALTLKGNGEYGVNLSGKTGIILDNILDIKAPVSISGTFSITTKSGFKSTAISANAPINVFLESSGLSCCTPNRKME